MKLYSIYPLLGFDQPPDPLPPHTYAFLVWGRVYPMKHFEEVRNIYYLFIVLTNNENLSSIKDIFEALNEYPGEFHDSTLIWIRTRTRPYVFHRHREKIHLQKLAKEWAKEHNVTISNPA